MTDQVQDGQDPITVANKWIEAYNAKDLDTIRSLCAPEIGMRHHNRGVDLQGPDAAIAIMVQFEPLVPDRRFHNIRNQFTDGETVVTELTWEATATQDIPGFAAKDEHFAIDLACIWKVRNGQICEYDDYG
jgi:steroid delta-isomerase-like uncharacterized protein